ncbi:MAG: beta-glucosidase [Acidimicrobiaceae bacterium]|nr:beta-glucosidase [Acidimicrobiaceae bacterium]|tara:strand:- start:2040 stop:3044 length:1005 start_codon:yes stop_codon:yes gene_type:complete
MAPPPGAADCIAAMPLATRVGQVLMPVVDQGGLLEVADLAGRGLIAGAVVVEPVDGGLGDAIASVQAVSATGSLVMAVDEEGGTVQRLDSLLGQMPSARQMAGHPIGDVRIAARQRAEAMAGLGFTMNLAPVVDVGAGPGIGSRSFSEDPVVVAAFGSAVAYGVLDAGLTPVAKHFPGHGRASADSHEELPVTPPFEDLEAVDLVPWRYMPPGTAVMVGHLSVPGLTDGVSTSLSHEAVTGLLRREMGFDGLVISDDLAMGAVAGGMDIPQAAVLSLRAGVDLLIVGPSDGVAGVAWELVMALEDGRLSPGRVNEAVERVLAQRGVDPCGFEWE